MQLDEFLSRLSKYRKSGNTKWGSAQYIAPCPSHDDKSPSLSITTGKNGGILVHCFGGCSVSDVCASVGVSTSDLMPEQGYSQVALRRPSGASVDDFVVELFENGVKTGKKFTQEDKERYRKAKMAGARRNNFAWEVAAEVLIGEADQILREFGV